MNNSILSKNPRLLKIFNFLLKKEKTIKKPNMYDGAYVSKYSCYESYLKLQRAIYFYEWSTLQGNKKIFKTVMDFYKFLEESNIKMPDYTMKSMIGDNYVIHFTCKPNVPELICGKTQNELQKDLDRLNGVKNETSNMPKSETPSSPSQNTPPYNVYDDYFFD